MDGTKAPIIDGVKYLGSTRTQREELITKHAEREFDFLGERYVLNHSMEPRQFCTLVGMLVYATGVLSLPTTKYFNVSRKIRLSSALNKDESLWDSDMLVGLSAKENTDLGVWVGLAERNEPVPTLSGKKDPPPFSSISAMYIIVDASEWGWGALLFGKDKVVLQTACGRWRSGEDFSWTASRTK
jgi:hypothetical protein